ncbi:MAG: uroporphyrinogen-III synthase [Gammaproteobacteria bacterium]
MSAGLAGVRVLVTRPAHQAENLCRMIEAEGGSVVRLPLLTIEPGTQLAEARRRLAAGHDLWIFTSANAVRLAAPLATDDWPSRLAAVGPATATAIAAAGHAAAATPIEGASSEALLALPEFGALQGQRVLLVTGEGGRRTLEQELAARGARVERAEVYRRVPLPYPPDAVAAALRRSDVIVITSGESLEHLVRLTPEAARGTLLKKALVVPAARVVEKARELGFLQPPRLAEPMSDAALCAACAPT